LAQEIYNYFHPNQVSDSSSWTKWSSK
jgi:hypothetical protein